MNTQSTTTDHPTRQHATIIGGSIAGLTAARVLTNHFAKVTIIERDPPRAASYRTGVPQGRHPHVLLGLGRKLLEEMFPGLFQQLLADGAVPFNQGRQAQFFINGGWSQPFDSQMIGISCSRPLLESAIYQRIAAHPKVQILHEKLVLGLSTDEQKRRVTGVHLRDRHDRAAMPTILQADLVVDASGRDSHAPEWLAGLGYTPPQERTINAFVGYSTRIYRKPAHFADPWKSLYIMAMYPHTPRGAVILPMEGDRWQVCLIGMNGDYPPTDEAGFMAFARSLRTPRFYEAIKNAEPLTEPYGYRRAENRMRYYENLPRYLENFLVTGDAVYAFNPVYGQGMSTAALASQTLDACLHQQDGQSLDGLAQRFQKALASVAAGPWQMATGQDLRWPKTIGGQASDPMTRLVQRYLDRVLATMPHSPTVAEAFLYVQNMLKPPTSLFHPKIMWQVLKPKAWHRRDKTAPSAMALVQPAQVGGD
jgi:2-polyprenyl-6-methoxyphenol hydroxylase-like FAD-dependent oxidoreductase